MKTFDEFITESKDVTFGVSGSLFSGAMDRERHRNMMQKLGAVRDTKSKSQDNVWVVSQANADAVEEYLSQFDKLMWGRHK
ncbi:hypothetical protein vBValMR10Z_242 [Vibrio phage vB_ValM_R10Z]|nr:hypothetical protein Va3_203 [Vibrio phage Va3]QNJ54782.1 hypothetical protein vBValMR10Z_242 [Vibrio phage vB_ValM_R10Z]QNJ55169.1 hypothetical protein vBValMR11Z_243 [Vibrio phage vB_ValM_R11Z]URQ03518.1 hypothetical protein PVA23_141 [Vibrio phage PVA23]